MWTQPALAVVAFTVAGNVHPAAIIAPPALDYVMLFGFISSVATIVFYIDRRYSRFHRVMLAASIGALAIYGFLAGVWPLAIVESIWCAAALRRSFDRTTVYKSREPQLQVLPKAKMHYVNAESRLSRMFGFN